MGSNINRRRIGTNEIDYGNEGLSYAISSTGLLLLSRNMFRSYKTVEVPGGLIIGSIAVEKDIIYVANSKGIYKSTDDGTTFLMLCDLASRSLISDPNFIYLGVTQNTANTIGVFIGKNGSRGQYIYSYDGGKIFYSYNARSMPFLYPDLCGTVNSYPYTTFKSNSSYGGKLVTIDYENDNGLIDSVEDSSLVAENISTTTSQYKIFESWYYYGHYLSDTSGTVLLVDGKNATSKGTLIQSIISLQGGKYIISIDGKGEEGAMEYKTHVLVDDKLNIYGTNGTFNPNVIGYINNINTYVQMTGGGVISNLLYSTRVRMSYDSNIIVIHVPGSLLIVDVRDRNNPIYMKRLSESEPLFRVKDIQIDKVGYKLNE